MRAGARPCCGGGCVQWDLSFDYGGLTEWATDFKRMACFSSFFFTIDVHSKAGKYFTMLHTHYKSACTFIYLC